MIFIRSYRRFPFSSNRNIFQPRRDRTYLSVSVESCEKARGHRVTGSLAFTINWSRITVDQDESRDEFFSLAREREFLDGSKEELKTREKKGREKGREKEEEIRDTT